MKTARVIEEHKTNYIISDGGKEFTATVRGSFFKGDDFPKVGDNVSYEETADDKAVIEEVLPRVSTITRKAVGTDSHQVLVANVDVIFIVMGLDGDFNLSRLERYLLLAKQSNVKAVVVLNKSDVVDEVATYIDEVKTVSDSTPVCAVSGLTGANMEILLPHLTPNTTAVLLGSSGAGKSTITNWLLHNDTQKVSGVREDDSRGRHTTTTRQLFTLPSGACLIDTPGMRELGIVDSTAEDENEVFKQLDELSLECKFSNCDHEKSKGCALVAAVESGDVPERQLKNYLKLQRERMFEESKHDEDLSWQRRREQKQFSKRVNSVMQKKRFDKGL